MTSNSKHGQIAIDDASPYVPCPFCMGTPFLMSGGGMPSGQKTWLHCANCETSGPVYWDKHNRTMTDEAAAEAIRLWSTRDFSPASLATAVIVQVAQLAGEPPPQTHMQG